MDFCVNPIEHCTYDFARQRIVHSRIRKLSVLATSFSTLDFTIVFSTNNGPGSKYMTVGPLHSLTQLVFFLMLILS